MTYTRRLAITSTFSRNYKKMKRLRQLHLYLGTLFAPAIFFFAFSGALQTFDLHTSEPGSADKPPAWIVTLAEIHKDQRLAKPHKRRAPPPIDAAAKSEHPQELASPEHQSEQHSPLPLKVFVLLLAIGLMATAVLGIYMAFHKRNNRRLTWIMLATGFVLPIALLYL
jgi:hypothetical protein